MRAVLYLRVSTEQQVDRYGLDVQRADASSYAERRGWQVVAVLSDDGKRGDLPAPDRPALQDTLGMLEDDLADVLVVPRLDRLARKLTTQEVVLARAWSYGVEVHAADMGEVPRDDPDDPMRTAMRQMVGVFAELDRAMLVKRLRDGRKAKAKQGGKAQGRYPFGWSKEGAVPREQNVMAYVRALAAQGESWRTIARLLNNRGPEWYPRTGRPWTHQNLAAVAKGAERSSAPV